MPVSLFSSLNCYELAEDVEKRSPRRADTDSISISILKSCEVLIATFEAFEQKRLSLHSIFP